MSISPEFTVLVIAHHPEDHAGFIGEAFQARGARIITHLYPQDGPLSEPGAADHVVVLGASYSVYDDGDLRPAIATELDWLRRAEAAGVPVLGICFGAQALCAALGGQVVPAPLREVGWRLVATGDSGLIPAGPWLEFHGDQCLPPASARILARNEVCVQAFAHGRHLAVQFHPEVDGDLLRAWLEAGGRTEAISAGQDPDAFLAETAAAEPAARARAFALVDAALKIAREVSPAPWADLDLAAGAQSWS